MAGLGLVGRNGQLILVSSEVSAAGISLTGCSSAIDGTAMVVAMLLVSHPNVTDKGNTMPTSRHPSVRKAQLIS